MPQTELLPTGQAKMTDAELHSVIFKLLKWRKCPCGCEMVVTPSDGRTSCISRDLEAMHQAEKLAPMGYADAVRLVVARDARVAPEHLCDQYLIHANARQRATAFVMVMKPEASPIS